MDDFEEVYEFDAKKALSYLKENFVVSSAIDHKMNYFFYKCEKVVVVGPFLKTVLSEEDFFKLYGEATFSLVDEEEPSVDLKRDEEYYSWRNK